MPPARTHDRRPRQDPVSCELCRGKKLRCNRQRPCSNCSVRRVACQYRSEPPLAPNNSGHPEEDTAEALKAENRAIKARLQRLEEAVFPGNTNRLDATTTCCASHSTATSTPRSNEKRPRTEGDQAEEDSHWLETFFVRSETIAPVSTDLYLINVASIEYFCNADKHAPQLRRIDLPTHDIATTALRAYAEHLDAVQHIMHVESTRKVIDDVYRQINAGVRPHAGALALILALCSNISFYSTVGLHRGGSLFSDGENAMKISVEWARQALFAIEQARISSVDTSLEAIQSSIMALFLFYHMEGFTFRVRMMHMTAIAMARDLGLHKIDAPGNMPPELTQAAIIDIEVKRKIWWHLSCTDWLMSFLGGPSEGMYSIHPRHMQVQLPRNLNRDDLNTQGMNFSRSENEPTIMSYYLERVKMATTCREIADALWAVYNPEAVDYEVVKSLDSQFEAQIRGFPRFLRVDVPSKQLRAEYGEAYNQQVNVQGVMVNLMINTRRCKLHLPFLIRVKQNPRFAYSRAIGLRAAREVFRVRQFAMEDEDSTSGIHIQLGGMLQHLFFATVALVMDICVNRDEDNPVQVAEVREALSIMQDSKDRSGRGAKFFDSLMTVLKKHHVKLFPSQGRNEDVLPHLHGGTQPAMTNGSGGANYQTATEPAIPSSVDDILSPHSYPLGEAPVAYSDPAASLDVDTNIFLDFLDQGMMLEPQDWEQIFTDLDMRMM